MYTCDLHITQQAYFIKKKKNYDKLGPIAKPNQKKKKTP